MHFSTKPRIITFDVDGEQYTTKPAVAAQVIAEFQAAITTFGSKDVSGAERLQAFMDLKEVYRRILTPESYALFEPRVSGDVEDGTVPIDLLMLLDITRWLVAEGLGKGHIQQSSSSTSG